jgi:hypothetical protein
MIGSIVLRISAALAVALTAGGVLVATGSTATANNGDPVLVGQTTTGTATTVVNDTTGGASCTGYSDHDGVVGCGFFGVDGYGGNTGVYGNGSSYGVWGVSSGNGVYGLGLGALNGVFGQTSSTTASGVYGQNDGSGYGVAGRADNGTGVLADSANGTALTVNGVATFSRSGIATVLATTRKVNVTNIALSPSSLVVATIQGNVAGTWVQGVTTSIANSAFTIFLNKAVTANAKVAWFVVN